MGERIPIALACTECETRNYKTTRRAVQPEAARPLNASGGAKDSIGPLTLKKFCPICNRHTVHKETK